MKSIIRVMGMLLLAGGGLGASAQLSVTGQLRVRSELRDGYGTLETAGSQPAFVTTQRARLTFRYLSSRVIFQTSVQDVRVWGGDASTIDNADGARLSVHEAWAELVLANTEDSSLGHSGIQYLGCRIGRQELVYDDQRLLGNLDWLQQARRHDAMVWKAVQRLWRADLGVAFNQNTDAFNYNGTYYTPDNIAAYVRDSKGDLAPTPAGFVPLVGASGLSAMNGKPSLVAAPGTNGATQNYKSMQFLYIAKRFHGATLSGLLLTDEFGRYKPDSVRDIAGTDTGYIYGWHFNQAGANLRITGGIYLTAPLGPSGRWKLVAGAYYQAGKNPSGTHLAAYTTTMSLTYGGRLFSATAGWDYLSGNNAFSSSTTDHRFDPLYGTPHKFWGYMDYFYAGTGSAAGGLDNPYVKAKYNSRNGRLTTELCYHYFGLAAAQKDQKGGTLDKYLGSEADWITDYSMNRSTTLEAGFCGMAATHSLEYAKGITPGSARLHPGWVYLQLNITPELFKK
ncbi:MAG TPA: alginate export family protein [Puia sp.]|nr:alginate export family protein [Puia sp.]